jgi:hypothetical protein
MSTTWISISTFTPYTGESIDFRLEDREESIHGTFTDGAFHSRWADYDSNRVQSWRRSVADPAHEVIAVPAVARRRAWFKPLAGLAKIFRSGADGAGPAPIVQSCYRTTFPPVRPVAAVSSGTQHRRDSNQISS